MKKGYILPLTLKILIIVTSLTLISYNRVLTSLKVVNEYYIIKERLIAEKYIFDEILYQLYAYIDDDFTDFYKDYYFSVNFDKNNILIQVEHDNLYTIKLTYDDVCHCFTNILYK